MSEQPMTYADLYPGRFLAAGSSAFAGGAKPTYTIADVGHVELEGERGVERKVVVTLRGLVQGWVLPKICATCLVAMWGGDVRAWIDRRVTLYATAEVMPFPPARGGRPEPCIRVWGSPDIDRDVPVVFTPPKRKPVKMTMHAVRDGGEQTRKAAASDQPPRRSPEVPDYIAEAEAAASADEVRAIWQRASKAGLLTADLRERLTALAKAKVAPVAAAPQQPEPLVLTAPTEADLPPFHEEVTP